MKLRWPLAWRRTVDRLQIDLNSEELARRNLVMVVRELQAQIDGVDYDKLRIAMNMAIARREQSQAKKLRELRKRK